MMKNIAGLLFFVFAFSMIGIDQHVGRKKTAQQLMKERLQKQQKEAELLKGLLLQAHLMSLVNAKIKSKQSDVFDELAEKPYNIDFYIEIAKELSFNKEPSLSYGAETYKLLRTLQNEKEYNYIKNFFDQEIKKTNEFKAINKQVEAYKKKEAEIEQLFNKKIVAQSKNKKNTILFIEKLELPGGDQFPKINFVKEMVQKEEKSRVKELQEKEDLEQLKHLFFQAHIMSLLNARIETSKKAADFFRKFAYQYYSNIYSPIDEEFYKDSEYFSFARQLIKIFQELNESGFKEIFDIGLLFNKKIKNSKEFELIKKLIVDYENKVDGFQNQFNKYLKKYGKKKISSYIKQFEFPGGIVFPKLDFFEKEFKRELEVENILNSLNTIIRQSLIIAYQKALIDEILRSKESLSDSFYEFMTENKHFLSHEIWPEKKPSENFSFANNLHEIIKKEKKDGFLISNVKKKIDPNIINNKDFIALQKLIQAYQKEEPSIEKKYKELVNEYEKTTKKKVDSFFETFPPLDSMVEDLRKVIKEEELKAKPKKQKSKQLKKREEVEKKRARKEEYTEILSEFEEKDKDNWLTISKQKKKIDYDDPSYYSKNYLVKDGGFVNSITDEYVEIKDQTNNMTIRLFRNKKKEEKPLFDIVYDDRVERWFDSPIEALIESESLDEKVDLGKLTNFQKESIWFHAFTKMVDPFVNRLGIKSIATLDDKKVANKIIPGSIYLEDLKTLKYGFFTYAQLPGTNIIYHRFFVPLSLKTYKNIMNIYSETGNIENWTTNSHRNKFSLKK